MSKTYATNDKGYGMTLREQVLYHAYKYYVLHNPEISDSEFDKLFHALKDAEILYGTPESERVTNKVKCGITIPTPFTKVPHLFPMLSLDNAFNEEDFQRWLTNLGDYSSTETLVYTPKIDGASLSLEYEDGLLKRILRRGDGQVGDDITHACGAISGIPGEIALEDHIIVRGEVICPAFDMFFADKYKNHRNFVSGSLNLKDPKEIYSRKLAFIAYFCMTENRKFLSDYYTSDMTTLEINGFDTVTAYGGQIDIHPRLTEREILDKMAEKTFDFPTDGVVFRVNSNKLFHLLGATSHHPHGAIAYKTSSDMAETRVNDVIWQVGKTGTVTPVALLAPIDLDGTTVSRATLHNFDEITELDLAVNDIVEVTKAGFIIPKILRVVSRPANRLPIIIPLCPSCNSKLIKQGAYLKCTNSSCEGKTTQEILKFVSSAKFLGFGKATIEKLVDRGLVETISDFLQLDYDQIYEVVDSEKIADKLWDVLQERPWELSFVEALASINIPMVNVSTAQKLVNSGIQNVFEMKDASVLLGVSGIGPIKAKAIADFVQANWNELEKLSKLIPLQMTAKDEVITDAVEATLTNVALSGTVSMPRTRAKDELKKCGFNLQDNVTKTTEILILGKNPGADKIAKAKKYGIQIVEYEGSNFTKII